MIRHRKALCVMVLACVASMSPAQSAPPPPGPAVAPNPPPPEPTLDDLLGLTRPKEAEKPAGITGELERQLSDREIDEGFAQAVDLMGQTATRLDGKDTGLDTQRLQQQALLKLDKLIAEAQRQSQQSRQKQKQKREQDQAEGQQQQQQQSSQSGQQQQQEQQNAGNQAGNSGVPLQEGQANAPRAGSSASWGGLPEHVRQALTQGRSDRFSSVYRQLTEQYYRRLAEEPKPAGAPR